MDKKASCTRKIVLQYSIGTMAKKRTPGISDELMVKRRRKDT